MGMGRTPDPNYTTPDGQKYTGNVVAGDLTGRKPILEMIHHGANSSHRYAFDREGNILGRKEGYDKPQNPDKLRQDAQSMLKDPQWLRGQPGHSAPHPDGDVVIGGLSINGMKDAIAYPPSKPSAPGAKPE